MDVQDIGKCKFIWNDHLICGGDAEATADLVAAAGFQSAILHSTSVYNWRTKTRIALALALKKRGVIVIGGAAVYGDNPIDEGRQAASICRQYQLPAFNFDAEAKWDAKPHSNSNASNMLKAFRDAVPNVLAGWCWWARYYNPWLRTPWHPKDVLRAAMAEGYGDADYGMPMAYWEGETPAAAVKYLDVTLKQWREVTDKPIVPAGRAYVGDGGRARPDAIAAFETRARELGCVGVAWWVMENALKLPGIWEALTGLPRFDGAAVKPEPKPIPPVVAPAPEPLAMYRCLATSGMIVRDAPAGKDTGERIVFNQRVTAWERKLNVGGYNWIKLDPGSDKWIADRWMQKL
jgi:hypothetical protein